jgi:hypothetical protein
MDATIYKNNKVSNFWKKRCSSWFHKNKQNINRNWRPKKTIWYINEELKKSWYPAVTQAEVVNAYLQIINLDKEWIEKVKQQFDKVPLLYKIIITNLEKNKWFDVLEKMLDRALWKALEKVTIKEELSEKEELLIRNLLEEND